MRTTRSCRSRMARTWQGEAMERNLEGDPVASVAADGHDAPAPKVSLEAGESLESAPSTEQGRLDAEEQEKLSEVSAGEDTQPRPRRWQQRS
eukprot:1173698-Pleurochrysis_carterae.AAC.2